MNIGKAFSYPFEDDEWLTKLFLGAIVSVVPILNFAWTGYTVDILRNVIDGVQKPLPGWSDFGDKFVKGFLITAAGFIYSLPALFVICIVGVFAIPAAIESIDYTAILISMFTGVGILFGCLLVLYFILLSFYLPAVFINFARKESFASCFEIREIIRIVSENTGNYFTAWLVSIVGAIIVGIVVGIISFILSFILCLGWILAWLISTLSGVYLFAIYAQLFGQVIAVGQTEVEIIEP
jgi:hypothetical protein